MIYSLKQYQRDAVDELKDLIGFYFNKKNKTVVFKAPTGSGKTFMTASLLEELSAEYNSVNFCVIWASIGKGELQKQSYDAVKTYLGGNPVCSLLEDTFFGSRKYIKNHEIVFVNWEKLIQKDKETGAWKNNLMQDQEGQNFLNVIDQTKTNGTKIILVVDESHIGASSSSRIAEFKSQVIIPDITLEMSATTLSDPDVEIDAEDVIKAGMIKNDVIVNEGIRKDNLPDADKDSELLVLEKAEAKRNELIEEYKKLNVNVNPLVLVQIPNTEAGEAKKLVVKDFLRNLNITEESGKLKQWCDDKGNFDKKGIKKNDDETAYLIFKTAIATGWDCPRAHILVKFREGKSETFEIQTIGRILRTAEAKSYDNSILDNAYIFTNIKDFETKKDTYNPNKIKTEFSYFKKGYTIQSVYEQTRLISFYRSRQGDYNSADSRYAKYFEEDFMAYFGFTEEDKMMPWTTNADKFNAKEFDLSIETDDALLEETELHTINIDKEQSVHGDTIKVKMSENDIQAEYYSVIKENLNGLAYARSKSPINMAIVETFSKFYNAFGRNDKMAAFQKMAIQNKTIISEILNKSLSRFRKMLEENNGKKPETYDFKIQDKRGYSLESHTKLNSEKSLYQPLYVLMRDEDGNVNNLEKDFINYLDSDGKDNVEWFWQNGAELMRVNFGIPYNNNMNTFQPDFIIKFKNGKVGIFDTKPINHRVEDTKIKAKALHKYLSDINAIRGDGHTVIGGIVVQKGSQFYYYDETEYIDMQADASNWKNFNQLFR